MRNYYIRSINGGIKQVSEVEFLSIVGDKQHRPYASKLYRGTITIDEVPEEKQEAVQEIVNNRIAAYGEYGSQLATKRDLQSLIQTFLDCRLTKRETKIILENLNFLRENSTDETASLAYRLFQPLKGEGALIKAGTRIRWADTIKRAAVDLWDTVENNPEEAPELWEDINYKNGYRVIPDVITVGTAFALDEVGFWKGKLYKSLLNANVYTPEAYPAGWEKVEV